MDIKTVVSLCRTLNLLYVEDDPVTQRSTLEMLQNFFTEISTANDGNQAIEMLQVKQYDLVITDINMPHCNGIELLKSIRSNGNDIPVIFMSAHDDSGFFLEAIYLDADGYIMKPVKQSQLIQALSKTIEKIHLKKQAATYQYELESTVRERTKELTHKLFHDDTTGLRNRSALIYDLHESNNPILCLLNINQFKLINELYGYSTATDVLKLFSKFLQDYSQNELEHGRAYRLYGDRFAFLLSDSTANIDAILNKIRLFLSRLSEYNIRLEEDEIMLDVTIGVATASPQIIENAEIALENAKQQRHRFAIYTSSMDKRATSQVMLECKTKLKAALRENRIVPVFHAIVDKHGETVKYEVLMRLVDEQNNNLIAPGAFLNTAIITNLYDDLSESVIMSALNTLLSHRNVTFSINIASNDLNNIELVEKIEFFFKEHDDLANCIIFEFTEDESFGNYEGLKSFIDRFRKYGARFAVDDFGSGFSNFNHLLSFDPDFIKIDGSLIKNIDTDFKSYVLVKAIVDFSKQLGIEVIAEFVHSQTIFEMLKVLDIENFQGYYFSEPVRNISNEY